MSLRISSCPGNLLSSFVCTECLTFSLVAEKKSDSFNLAKYCYYFREGGVFSANTGPSVGSLWELLQRVRDGSVSRWSSRLPLCVTLWCVITSRIIGSVGGNSKWGYWGRSDSEEKQSQVRTVMVPMHQSDTTGYIHLRVDDIIGSEVSHLCKLEL